MTDTYGCPIKNSAKPITHMSPLPTLKRVKPIQLMDIDAGLKIKKKIYILLIFPISYYVLIL